METQPLCLCTLTDCQAVTGLLVALGQRGQVPGTDFGQDLGTENTVKTRNPPDGSAATEQNKPGGLHLLVGVQDGQQQVLWAKLSALLLQREARQQAALLVVTLGGLLAQPQHGEGVGLAGTQRR